MQKPDSLYIELLKQCLLGEICEQWRGPPPLTTSQYTTLLQQANEAFKSYLSPLGHDVESFLLAQMTSGATQPVAGFDEILCANAISMHPGMTPDTMSDRASVENLQWCVETAIKDRMPGDLIETGVWKGGLSVLMRGILKAHGIADRFVWAADSFEGLPKPDAEKDLLDAIWYFLLEPLDRLKIPLGDVENTFRKYRLLDEQVKFLPGWFSDTLPNAPIERLAVMRLDGDWYESTMCALSALYPKLSTGGFVISDDYGVPTGCRQATDEFRLAHRIEAPIEWVNHHVVYWRK